MVEVQLLVTLERLVHIDGFYVENEVWSFSGLEVWLFIEVGKVIIGGTTGEVGSGGRRRLVY